MNSAVLRGPNTGRIHIPHDPVWLLGVYSARVVNIDDPHRQSQVQVQHYWQEQGQTTWIRHLTPYADAQTAGSSLRPEIGR